MSNLDFYDLCLRFIFATLSLVIIMTLFKSYQHFKAMKELELQKASIETNEKALEQMERINSLVELANNNPIMKSILEGILGNGQNSNRLDK